MRLLGECTRCGACCVTLEGLRCAHLVGTVGVPGGTHCRVYATRTDGMPIVFVGAGPFRPGVCRKDSLAEVEAIVRQGFGRGCSLSLESVA